MLCSDKLVLCSDKLVLCSDKLVLCNDMLVSCNDMLAGFYLLGGAGGKVPPQTLQLPPQNFSQKY